MKLKSILGWSSALCLSALVAQAQETNEVERLNQQLKQIEATFDKQQREMRENFERKLREQQAQIEALKKELAAVPTNAPAAQARTAEQLEELNDKVDAVVQAQTKSLPSEFNPSIGFVGETIFSYNSRGNNDTGFERPGGFDVFQRSMELGLAASVDPFARGYAVFNATADAASGEATVGAEEAALETTALPWNLSLKAGRFFGEFGRLAYIHDHELPFVNRPLVLDQYIGGESRTDGAQVSWLLPTSHYINLTAGAGDSFGGGFPNPGQPGTYRPLSGLNYFGRLSTFFDLTPNWNIETGGSGLINPTTQDRGGVDAFAGPGGVRLTEKERRVAGLDFRLNWLPLRENQFKSFTWGSELLYSDSGYQFDPDGLPGNGDEYLDSVGSLGLYSYATYKWHRQWSGGFLFQYVQDPCNRDIRTFAYSPYLTYAISHWNMVRLQYTHTQPNALSGFKPDEAFYLQWAWIIGSHTHGWQQR